MIPLERARPLWRLDIIPGLPNGRIGVVFPYVARWPAGGTRPADQRRAQIDELDQQTRSGWSIVLHGHSSAVREPEELADLWASDSLVPRASGNRTLFIRIGIDRIASRMVRRPS